MFNNKKIAAIIVFGLTMTTCATPATGHIIKKENIEYTDISKKGQGIDFVIKHRTDQLKINAEIKKASIIKRNNFLLNKNLKKLKSYVGKTWYVFSGSNPSGWDCSGLTLWFYEQFDVSIKHRASIQGSTGIETLNPKPGDLVVFKYSKSTLAYHVGIYIGNGNMVHAPKHGHLTRIESIKKFSGSYSDVTYRHILKTN